MEAAKTCTRCGEEKPFSEFGKHRLGRHGLRPRCKQCTAAENADYRARTVERRAAYNKGYRVEHREQHLAYNKRWNRENADRIQEAVRRWRQRNPVKYQAQKQLSRAIESGALVRPATCEQCERRGPLQGHHEDYDRPLEVVWLCPRCHAARR